MPERELDRFLAETPELIVARSNPGDQAASGRSAGGGGPHGGDDRRRRERRARPATRRHRRRHGAVGHRRGARGGDDGPRRRQLRLDRRRRRGGAGRLREHPQVHHLHLRPRDAGGGAVPDLRPLRRRSPIAAHRAADPRHRPRHRDASGVGARPRAGGARNPRAPATLAAGKHRPGRDAHARLALAGPARGSARNGRIPARPIRGGLVARRRHRHRAPRSTTTTWRQRR